MNFFFLRRRKVTCVTVLRTLYMWDLNSYKIVSVVPNHLIACSTYIKKFRVIRILSTDDDLNENHCASVIKDPVSPQPASPPPASFALCFIGRCCTKPGVPRVERGRKDLRGSETVCHLRTTNGRFTLLHYIF